MKNDSIDYKRKEKILTGSVITSTAVLLGLYLNNEMVVKADSVPTGQNTTQAANSVNTETGNSTNQNENNATETGTIDSTQNSTNTSPNDEEIEQATSKTSDLTRAVKTYTWNGLNLVFDDATGELTIPGGTDANPVVLRNPTPLYFLPNREIYSFKKITITGKIKIVGSADHFLAFIPHVTEISGLENLDTSDVTNMSIMFGGCYELTSLDLSHFDTSNVTDTSFMFSGSNSLTSINLSSFDTAKVINMSNMFNNCAALTSLDLRNFDTSKVIDMSFMFHLCEHLSNLNISSFDMSKAQISRNASGNLGTNYLLTGLPNLRVLVLGPKCILQDAGLTKSDRSINTGATIALDKNSKWINVAEGSLVDAKGNKIWTPAEMTARYNGSTDHDTYIRFGVVKVHYRDTKGNEILEDREISGLTGESYDSVAKKNILGYTFKEVQGDTTRTYNGSASKEVTYIYTENPDNPVAPTVTSKVTVNYQDENGNQIASDEVLTGKVGDGYQTMQKTISGYTFKEVRGNATGFFTSNEQTVTYIYTKDDGETVLPVKPATKPNKHKPQKLAVKKQQKSNPVPNRTENKADPLPQTGANKESNGIIAALGSMMVLISFVSGAWFKRKKK